MKKIITFLSILFLNIFLLSSKACAEIAYSCEGQQCIDDLKMLFSYLIPIIIILPLLLILIIFFIIWLNVGKEEKTFEVVEFNPIEGFSMLELDYIYNQTLTPHGVLAELLELEAKGYVTHSENRDSMSFYKKKDYDGEDNLEKKFMDYVFLAKILQNSPIEAFMLSKLYSQIKKNLDCYIKTLGGCFNSCLFYMVYLVISFIYVFLPSVYFFNITDKFEDAAIGACGGFISFMIPFFVFGTIKAIKNKLYKEILIVGGILILLASTSTGLILSVNEIFLPKILIISGVIGLSLLLIIAGELPKYTAKGRELYQKLKGLKRYLEKVEVPKLEAIKQENPEYYNKILPYLYIFGIKDTSVTNLADRGILIG